MTAALVSGLSRRCSLAPFLVLWLGLAAPSFAFAGAKPTGVAASFEKLCYSCHNIGGGDKTGPDLSGLTSRRSREWIHRFVASPQDLKQSGDRTAKELFAKFSPEVMPDQTLSADQLDEFLDLIETLTSKNQFFVPQSGRLSRQPTPKDIPAGRALFTGAAKLAQGGPACLSCHSVTGIGALQGGTLGPDLTAVARKYRDVELASILKAPAFRTMSKLFTDQPLSDEEVVKVFAYLRSARAGRPETARAGLDFLLLGAAGALASLVGAAVIWRGRLSGVRKSLVRKMR